RILLDELAEVGGCHTLVVLQKIATRSRVSINSAVHRNRRLYVRLARTHVIDKTGASQSLAFLNPAWFPTLSTPNHGGLAVDNKSIACLATWVGGLILYGAA